MTGKHDAISLSPGQLFFSGGAQVFLPSLDRAVPGAKDKGSRLATAGEDGILRIWDMRSGDLLFAMQPSMQPYGGTPGAIKCLAVTNIDGQTILASGGKDSCIRLWNIRTGQMVAELGKVGGQVGGACDVVFAHCMRVNVCRRGRRSRGGWQRGGSVDGGRLGRGAG